VLFYCNWDKIMFVEVIPQSHFAVGKPRMLSEEQYLPAAYTNPNYDVSSDG
jgi:hypothetical protein